MTFASSVASSRFASPPVSSPGMHCRSIWAARLQICSVTPAEMRRASTCASDPRLLASRLAKDCMRRWASGCGRPKQLNVMGLYAMPADSNSLANGAIRASLRRRIDSTQSWPAPEAAGLQMPTSRATKRPEKPETLVQKSAGRSPGCDDSKPVGSSSDAGSSEDAAANSSSRTLLCPLVLGPHAHSRA